MAEYKSNTHSTKDSQNNSKISCWLTQDTGHRTTCSENFAVWKGSESGYCEAIKQLVHGWNFPQCTTTVPAVILCERLGSVHPIIYALLSNKIGDSYERLFRLVRDLCPNAAPQSLSIAISLTICVELHIILKWIHKLYHSVMLSLSYWYCYMTGS